MHLGHVWRGGRICSVCDTLSVLLLHQGKCFLYRITCSDQVPSLHQQHHIGPLEVLSAVGAQQPGGVAQHSQDAPVYQVIGHICIDSSQRVIEEIECFLLDRTDSTP